MKQQDETYGIIAQYYAEHFTELRAFVGKYILNAPEAEDIVQNVFLRLLTSEKMITPVTLPSLVYTVARNLMYDYWRHRHTVDEYEHNLPHVIMGSCAHDVHTVYSVVEMTELLEKGIARLNSNQRDIYRMNVHDGLQVSEISERLSLPYKSVEHRLGDARKEIRNYMKRMLA